MRKQTEKPKYWSMGKVLPGGYVVVDHLGQGGMGTVYLVEKQVSLKTHSYAVKTMIPEIADNTGRRRDFLRELRTWIDLPTHPNLVACRFFRTIDNTLAVFAEYVQGSSLNRWIINNSNAPVETLLDIAIQIAWGLECAHVAGVIHQDVKPSNILIAENNTAKVTDFGLARSRYTGTAPLNTTDTGETLLISSRGMTMPYCSLEQAMGRKISRRTDMWSFGLTVLEMFNGGLTWRLGSEAIQILEYHLQEGPLRPMPEMPGELIKILRGCFEEDPQKRWESMSMVADRLIALYEQVTGRCYFRSVPIPDSMDIVEEAQDRHTSDGGWWVDPVKFYQETQELLDVGEPFNVEELQEPPQSSQRARALHDIELFELAEELLQASIAVGSGEESWCVKLANSHFNKALAIESCQDMRNAAETYQQAIDVLSGIKSRIAIELAARSYMNQSGCLLLCGDQERSLETINQAIERYRQLMDNHPDPREIRMFVNSLMNKAVVLNQMMQMKESLEYLEKAMSHCEHLLELDNTNSNWNMLGFIQVNLVMLRYHQGEMDRALDMAIQSMDIFQYLFDQSNTYDSASVLGVLYHKKAQIYRKKKQPVRCRENIIQGIDFLQSQLRQAGREDLRVHLAELFGFQAEQYLINGDLDDARQTITNARELLETVVVEEDQAHHKLTLARISLSETIIYFAGADRSLGQKYGVMAVGFWVQLVDSNELDISSMRREMNVYVSNFLDDFQLFETDKSIVEIFKKIVRTMFSKFPEADPETWPVFQLLR